MTLSNKSIFFIHKVDFRENPAYTITVLIPRSVQQRYFKVRFCWMNFVGFPVTRRPTESD